MPGGWIAHAKHGSRGQIRGRNRQGGTPLRHPAPFCPLLSGVVLYDEDMESTKTKRAVGYVRVSTEKQASEGLSLEAQRARLEAWATAHGFELVSIHVDAGLSGSRADNRPALQGALDAACDGGAALVVYSLSRLARSTTDAIQIAERLRKSGADLVSLSESIDTTSAAGRMVFKMLAVLAEFERDLVSERTAAAMAHKRSRMEYNGGEVEFGYRLAADGVHLEEEPTEQKVLAMVQELRAGGLSYRAIGRHLEAAGAASRSGGSWHPQTIKNLCTRLEAA